MGSGLAMAKQPGAPTDGDWPDVALGQIVVQAQTRIVQETHELGPLVVQINEGTAQQSRVTERVAQVLVEPSADAIQMRRNLLLSMQQPFRG